MWNENNRNWVKEIGRKGRNGRNVLVRMIIILMRFDKAKSEFIRNNPLD